MDRLHWKHPIILQKLQSVAYRVILLVQYLKHLSGFSWEQRGADRKGNASKAEAARNWFCFFVVKSPILTCVKFKNNPDSSSEAADYAVCLTPQQTAFISCLCKQMTSDRCRWWNWKTWFEIITFLRDNTIMYVPYTAFNLKSFHILLDTNINPCLHPQTLLCSVLQIAFHKVTKKNLVSLEQLLIS